MSNKTKAQLEAEIERLKDEIEDGYTGEKLDGLIKEVLTRLDHIYEAIEYVMEAKRGHDVQHFKLALEKLEREAENAAEFEDDFAII